MTVEVCTVFAPRGDSELWEHYLPLLRLQRDTAAKFGHSHRIVTDAPLAADFTTLRVPLDPCLMRAMIEGVLARLTLNPAGSHVLFVDADCLIARDLHAAFADDFDLGLTCRQDEVSPINNGAMYVPRGSEWRAARIFRRALADCGEHWGADQEAISRAVAPVLKEGTIDVRDGCRVRFLNMRDFAAVPKMRGKQHLSKPFVIHFKGEEAKDWAHEYATRFILAK